MQYEAKWIEHKGKRILMHNYIGLSAEEALGAIRQYERYNFENDLTDILLLIDVTGTNTNDALVRAFKESAQKHSHRYKQVAVIGVEGLKRFFLQTISRLSTVPATTFKTRDEALEWLATHSRSADEHDYSQSIFQDKYFIKHRLGAGGMGVVYLAEHQILNRTVAIKLLQATYADSDEDVTRFFREAKASAAIRHPNIVDVLDVGITDRGEPYIVMEYLEGENLSTVLKRFGTLELSEACTILEQTLLALSSAHERRIVHRDLKPENIFLSVAPDRPPMIKLIDFGISKFLDPGESTLKTQTGSLLGTPAYMAPEQLHGFNSSVDQRTDLFSVGIIFNEMLTGQKAFENQQWSGESTSPSDHSNSWITRSPGLSDEAFEIIERATAILPQHRFSSADELLDAIRETDAYRMRDDLTRLIAPLTGHPGESGHDDSTKASSGQVFEVSRNSERQTGSHRSHKRRTSPPPPTNTNIKPALTGAIAAVLVMSTIFVGRELLRPAPEPFPQVNQAAATSNLTSNSVQITVQNAPAGAQIIFDGMPIPQSPFRVRKQNYLIKLEVHPADGPPFVTAVLPDRDRLVAMQ